MNSWNSLIKLELITFRVSKELFRSFKSTADTSGIESLDLCWNCFWKCGEIWIQIRFSKHIISIYRGKNPWPCKKRKIHSFLSIWRSNNSCNCWRSTCFMVSFFVLACLVFLRRIKFSSTRSLRLCSWPENVGWNLYRAVFRPLFGHLWRSIDTLKISKGFLGFLRILPCSLEFLRDPWNSLEFLKVPQSSSEFLRNISRIGLGFSELLRVP